MTPPRPCQCCNNARTNPTYPRFNLGCVYCGARPIQRIGLLQISQTDCRQRRQTVLKDWVEYGRSETQIRKMVAGPHCIGPDKA